MDRKLNPFADRLRVSVPPCYGESARGWTIRVAEANGYPHPRWLNHLGSGEKVLHFADSPATLQRLIAMTGCPLEFIDRLGTVQSGRVHYRLMNAQQVAVGVLNRSSAKVCPECLIERRMLSSAWDLKFWIGCPLHGRRLLDDCEGCESPLSWNRGRVDRCCETHPLTVRRGAMLDTHSVDLLRVFAQKIGIAAPPPTPELAELTAAMDIEQLSTLVTHLGLLSKWRADVPKNEATRLPGNGSAIHFLAVAAEILCKWPTSFHGFVDRITAGRREHDINFQGSLRKLVESLTKALAGDAFCFMRRELEVYARCAYGLRSSTLSKVDARQDEFLSHNAAATELNVHFETLARWLACGTASGMQLRSGRHKRWFLSRSEIDRLAEELGSVKNLDGFLADNGLVTQTQAATILGLQSHMTREIFSDCLVAKTDLPLTRICTRKARLIPRSAVLVT